MAHPPLPDASSDDLDTRIRRAELALMARDARVKRQVALLGQRVRRARDPARWVMPVAGGALALLAGWWLWRRVRPRPAPHAAAHHAAAAGAARPGKLDWLELVALAWPFIPEHWRQRWGSNPTSAMMNLGMLASRYLMDGLRDAFSHAGEARDAGAGLPPLRTVAQVDLGRYAGTWYEIARLPNTFERACSGQPRAHYALREGGVLEVLNGCFEADGHERLAHGQARVRPGSHGAKLEVTFLPTWLRWLPIGWADYWILHLADDYSLALIGEPGRRNLWVLAREPQIAPEALAEMVELARGLGFPVEQLQVSQPGPAAS
ncbi:lipocalin family protein [Ideonella sp.]|uniref:lipocalin family protein n=1 Tax=Ideonella sp. TaxID=1929293 RepID=UPI0035B26E55